VIPVVWIMMVEFLTLDGISTQGVLVLFLQHFVAWVQYNSQRLSIRALFMPPIIYNHFHNRVLGSFQRRVYCVSSGLPLIDPAVFCAREEEQLYFIMF
jgi:hypothetical protein